MYSFVPTEELEALEREAERERLRQEKVEAERAERIARENLL